MKNFRARIIHSYSGLHLVKCGQGTYCITGKRGKEWVATIGLDGAEVAKASTKNGALYAVEEYHNAL